MESNSSIKTLLPPPEQAFEWPQQEMDKQNWSEAAQRWAVLRLAYPDHPATWIEGASANIKAGELDVAESLLDQARQKFPHNLNVMLQYAELAMQRNEMSTAEDILRQAREQSPDFIHAWLKSAELAEQQGDMALAIKFNEQARQRAPDRPIAFIQYAELAMRAEQWEQALERWQSFRNQFPEWPMGYQRAAEAARQLGRLTEARKLTLAHQYGNNIIDNDSGSQSIQLRGGHTNPVRLMELIWTKAKFGLRSEVQRNYLSYGWWILEPVLHMVVYYLVFGKLLQRGDENYIVFLLTGLIPWLWFSKSISGSSNSITAGQYLMLHVGLPSVVFPLVSLLQATLKQIPIFLLLFGFVWLQGYSPDSHWWALLPVIIVQALLTIALACAVAAIIPFARDLSYLVPTGLMLMMFMSGIFYDYRSISPDWQGLFLSNPLAFLLKSYRDIIVDGALPDFQMLAWWGLGSLIASMLLLLAYKRLRYVYPRIVME